MCCSQKKFCFRYKFKKEKNMKKTLTNFKELKNFILALEKDFFAEYYENNKISFPNGKYKIQISSIKELNK